MLDWLAIMDERELEEIVVPGFLAFKNNNLFYFIKLKQTKRRVNILGELDCDIESSLIRLSPRFA